MKTPKKLANYESYFRKHGLDIILDANGSEKTNVNELVLTDPYKPNLSDLYRLHRLVIENRRTTILEFGVGWSTLVLAHALSLNEQTHKDSVKYLRRKNPFEVHSVDNEEKFIKLASSRIPESLSRNVFFSFSDVRMTLHRGCYATEYHELPLINPDLIYLDGPDQFNLTNTINGFSTAHTDLMPMGCDILKIEHFLIPGTIIVVDGRGANARFIKCNLQRNWKYTYSEKYDQHLFYLNEKPLGKINKCQLQFYSGKQD